MTNQTDFKDLSGFIFLHRKVQDNWLWLSEPFSKAQAWIDLLLSANHKDGSFFLRGIKIEVKRGRLARGEELLAFRWKWSKGKVRGFLRLLENEQQIKLHRSNKINIIEILNYNSYQKVTDRVNDKKTAERQQKDPNNNNNNDNNDDNNIENQFERIYRLFNKGKKLKVIPFDRLKTKFENCLKTTTFEELEKNVNNYLDYLSIATWRKKKAFEAWINSSECFANDWIAEKKLEEKKAGKTEGGKSDYEKWKEANGK